MQQFMIRLSTIQDIRRFVETVSMTDIEVDLSSQRYIVDGKSIMGIYSLDLLNPIMLTVHSDNCPDLIEKLQHFIIKDEE
jgi:phosphotransferase system HPr-like phosphotransfer protein